MATTSTRTLRLLTLLQTRRHWPGAVLAGRLGISPRTLRRDIERLRDLGYPVDAQPGVDGGYALTPGAALPPLVVDDDEAMALGIAIQSHLASVGPEGGDAALRALTKVIQVMPRRLRSRLDALGAATTAAPWGDGTPAPVDHGVLLVLALGCRDGERVRFEYRAITGEPSTRRVEPLRLVPVGRRWYLVGYDLDRGDWRTFRIDRVREARGTGSPFRHRTPPFDDVAGWVRERVGAGSPGGRHRVAVDIEAPSAAVTQVVGGWATVRPRSTTSCTLTMDTDSLDGPLWILLTLGAEFRSVEPPELAALVADHGARFARAGMPSA